MSFSEFGIVIEIGTLFTRCGFAGEYAPRRVIRNSPELVKFLSIKRQSTIKPDEKIRYIVHEHFRNVFYSVLLVTLKEQHKFFISLNIYHNERLKNHIDFVLKEKFGAKNVWFLNTQVCSLFGVGSTSLTGLVIDCGYEETRIVPICHGSVISSAVKIVKIGGRWILEELKKEIVDFNRKEKGVDYTKDLVEEVLEDILIRVCFCDNKISSKKGGKTPKSQKSLTFFNPQSVTYTTHRNNPVIVPVEKRTSIFDKAFAGDIETESLSGSVLDCLLSCEMDARIEVVSNIILCGGLCDVVGFPFKLFTQIWFDMESKEKYKGLKGLFEKMRLYQGKDPESQIGWIGASILSNKLRTHPQKRGFVKEKLEIEIAKKKRRLLSLRKIKKN